MSNYINAEFICNEYYLLANLLKDSYKIGDILENGRANLDSIPEEERTLILEQLEQFMNIANNISSIQSILNFGRNFDRLPDSEKGKYNKYMNRRIDKMVEVESDEQFAELEGVDVLQAFNQLRKTLFYKAIKKKTLNHKEVLQSSFTEYESMAEETLKPILEGSQSEKKAKIFVRPPELYDDPYTLGSYGNTIKSVASYPKSFDEKYPNLKVIAMMHEIMHEYIPLPPSEQFKNETQREVYYVVNHSLVELATNCELGMKVCDVKGYFQIPMHNEILKKHWEDEEGIKKETFIEQGVCFPSEFEFESTTQYFSKCFEKKTETQKDELSNDKIRGIVYPYFLAFKNRNAENPVQNVNNELIRDRDAIIGIYGQNYYDLITNPEYLKDKQEIIKNINNIIELNDVVAKEAFGIEKERTKESLQNVSEKISNSERKKFTDRISNNGKYREIHAKESGKNTKNKQSSDFEQQKFMQSYQREEK